MKIRTAMLLAGSFFGLPTLHAQTTAPQIGVASYKSSFQRIWTETCGGMPEVCGTETYEVNYSPSYITSDLFDHDCCSPCDWYITRSWPGTNVSGYSMEWRSGGPECSYSTNRTISPFNGPIEMGRYNLTSDDINGDGSYGWSEVENRNSKNIVLAMGGAAGAANNNIVRVWMTAYNKTLAGWPVIPAAQYVTMWGRGPDGTNWNGGGYWNHFLADNTETDVTPSVAGDWMKTEDWIYYDGGTHHAEITDIGYGLSVETTKPLIYWGGADVTDKTNVVWVGERIDLACRLNLPMTGVTLSNFQWTVPGIRIGYWDGRTQWGRTTTLTNFNRSTIEFYWVQDTAEAVVVECTAEAAGQTFNLRTTYEIRRPTATWYLYPQGRPVRVTKDGKPAQGWDGYYHLTTGLGWSLTNVGMYYEYEMTDLKGFTNQYSVSMVQTVWVDWHANIEDGGIPETQPKSYVTITDGLDGPYPYVNWGWDRTSYIDDTPKSPLGDYEKYFWRRDKFWSYLMWKSERRASIAVPLRLWTWDWRGAAQKLDRNSPPTWQLNGATHPRGGYGFDYYIHPLWERSLDGDLIFQIRTENNWAYPTP
jgi:hypothetical protein